MNVAKITSPPRIFLPGGPITIQTDGSSGLKWFLYQKRLRVHVANIALIFLFYKMLDDKIKRGFRGHLLKRYQSWLAYNKKQDNSEAMLDFLITKSYIPDYQIKQTFVVDEVNARLQDNGISKTATAWSLEAEYGIPESTTFYILDKHQKRNA